MKLLVVGCGSIGRRHIANLLALRAGAIIAHDIEPQVCRQVRQDFGIDAFADIGEALGQKPDAALICTTTSRHIGPAIEAARRGCHLFIEKPLSHVMDGIDELIRITDAGRLVGLVGCNMRFHPGIAGIKRLLGEEAIGRVLCARVQSGQYLPDWHPGRDYRQGYSARSSLGGGVLLDGIHEIDYIRWLLGDVRRVSCLAGHLSSLEIDTEDTAEILLGLDSGAMAEVHLDYIQRTYARSCQLIGEKGTILWDINEGRVRLYLAERKEWQIFPEPEGYEINRMYVDEMRHFLDCLAGKAKPLQDIREGKRALEIALAAKKSAETGRVVEVGAG